MSRFARPVAYEPTSWLRGPARFSRGWLELDTTLAEEYQPYELEGMLFAVAAIRSPAEALQFVERFGLLRTGPNAQEFREPWQAWLHEIHGLRGALMLYGTLRRAVDGDKDALAELWRVWAPIFGEAFEAPAGNDEELLAQASVFVAWLISEKLEGVEARVAPAVLLDVRDGQAGSPGDFVFVIRAPNLLGYIYHELALKIVQRAPVATCEACGRLFPVRDARQRFCSTRCANRQRYRRWVERRGVE